MKIELLIK